MDDAGFKVSDKAARLMLGHLRQYADNLRFCEECGEAIAHHGVIIYPATLGAVSVCLACSPIPVPFSLALSVRFEPNNPMTKLMATLEERAINALCKEYDA